MLEINKGQPLLALDCDGTLTQVGQTSIPHVTKVALEKFQQNGGQVVLVSGRGETHLRETLASTHIQFGLGECGYLLVEATAGTTLSVPTGFNELYQSAHNPVTVMHELGVPEFLGSISRQGVSVFAPHRNHDRRATYCVKAIRNLISIEELRTQIREQFGYGLAVFRNGHIGDIVLPNGTTSAIDTIHIAPCDPNNPELFGKSYGLSALSELFETDKEQIHFGGDSIHDLEAAINAQVNAFGVANCDSPERWRKVGFKVMDFEHGFGVAEYIQETFPSTTSITCLDEPIDAEYV